MTTSTMPYFLDTEFVEYGEQGLIIPGSIGITSLDGRDFYAEYVDMDWSSVPQWHRDNIYPHLKGGQYLMTRDEIRQGIVDFIRAGGKTPEFWAYFAAYDWVVLCQTFGAMINLPDGWPMRCNELDDPVARLGNPELPPKGAIQHHALHDAKWDRELYIHLKSLNGGNLP